MNIAHRTIGANEPPLIIAEIGINHGGDIEVAKKMVQLASLSGAECVKHQTHFVQDEMTDEAKSIFPPNDHRSIWDVIEQSALSAEHEIELKEYAEGLGLIYISTPFSRAAADFLDSVNVSAIKIGSGEVDNVALVQHIAGFGRPVIMSTGMNTVESVEKSVQILRRAKIPYALLQCTNLYPSPPEYVSLAGVQALKAHFPDALVGFSDHSIGPYMSLAAVALGACIIERHFTDSRYRVGPDVSCSMDPAELRVLIDRSKEIHTAVHTPKRRSQPEEAVYRFARSSVVADADLPAGHTIAARDIWARRPGSGEIPGYSFEKVLGKTLKRAVKKNLQLRWSDFE